MTGHAGVVQIETLFASTVSKPGAAIVSEKPAMLATYRMELGDKFIPVKNVFVPLWIKGRRWGNYELAYRDD